MTDLGGPVHQGEQRPASFSRRDGAGHSERKHSKFSASGAERWLNCPGSVKLSEGLPDKSSPWAEEGTRAHEVLERILTTVLTEDSEQAICNIKLDKSTPAEMVGHALQAAKNILKIKEKHPGSTLLVESKVHLDFIHPEMFGTFDAAIIDYFGTLHVYDYKYGAGVSVSPKENLQMIFYGLGLAHLHHWNFKRVRLWIIQPRIKGYDGPVYWDLPTAMLKEYIEIFASGVAQVTVHPEKYNEGDWCQWCKAKNICPLKFQKKQEKTGSLFTKVPF